MNETVSAAACSDRGLKRYRGMPPSRFVCVPRHVCVPSHPHNQPARNASDWPCNFYRQTLHLGFDQSFQQPENTFLI